MNFKVNAVLGCAVLLFTGCATTPNEIDVTELRIAAAATMPTAVVTGSTNLASKYEFPLQAPVVQGAGHNFVTFKGTSETITQGTGFGELAAWSSTDAPQMLVGWPSSMALHDDLARQYVLRVGIPETELGSIQHFHGGTAGAPIADPRNVVRQSSGFSTVFSRVIAGILVLDSHAGVQLNANGVPVALSVMWPVIPSSVVVQAHLLQARVAAGWIPPPVSAPGRPVVGLTVVIRHSGSGSSKPSIAPVLRQELGGPGMRSWLDTDDNGNLVSLVEVGNAPAASQK